MKTSASTSTTWLLNGNGSNTSKTLALSGSFYQLAIYAAAGVAFNNITIYPMLAEGETALPYERYFEGLRDAKVTAIESVGLNRLDLSKAVNNSLVANADGTYTFTKNGNSRFSAVFPLRVPDKTVVNGYMEIVSTNIPNLSGLTVRLRDKDQATTGKTMALRQGGQDYLPNVEAYYADMYFNAADADGYVTFRNPMITYGYGAKTYAPYAKHTLPIPEAVQALDGYGQGNPDDATEYNYIDFDTQEFVKKGAIVDGAWVRGESVTDISHILTADNMLAVEGCGTITAVNEYEMGAPTEITYQLKEGTV